MSGQWKRIEIGGKPAELFMPEQRREDRAALIHLHGHGEITLENNPVYTAELDRLGLACVCPHGRRSWWMDRVCREFDPQLSPFEYLSRSVVPYMESELQVRRPGIGVMGSSMGGHGAMYFAFHHPRDFPVVAAISPTIDFHQLYGIGLPLDELFRDIEEARQESVILNINPLNWPRHLFFCCDPADTDWFPGADRMAMKLSSSGIIYERDLETSAGGHSWDYFNHMAPKVLTFVAQKLSRVLAE